MGWKKVVRLKMTSEGRVCLGLADVKRHGVTEEIVLTEQLHLLLFTVYVFTAWVSSRHKLSFLHQGLSLPEISWKSTTTFQQLLTQNWCKFLTRSYDILDRRLLNVRVERWNNSTSVQTDVRSHWSSCKTMNYNNAQSDNRHRYQCNNEQNEAS